ncbi:GNAT family N-acetyltransferase [Candidatus Woesearchaeota archaeon]|nr:GNAT family N-acetyltransferase [Candidatus Woesearchaeota archaeon]
MITFSNETRQISEKDIAEAADLAENYFHTAKDKTQLRTNKSNFTWILIHYPNCLNIIKSNRKVVGFTLVLPCNNKLMSAFLKNKMTERELLKAIKEKITLDNFEVTYLCACYINPEFRRKGLAKKAFVDSVKRIGKTDLFYWEYSREGRKLMEKVADVLKLRISKK